MNRITQPSPALIVAVLALVAALGGTALAANPTAQTSALNKKKVKKITTKQINKLAPGLSVAQAETATNATNATNAENADQADNATTVNNVGVQGVRYRTNDTANNPTQIVTLGGLTLTANCQGGNLSLVASTSTDNATLSSAAIDTATDSVDPNTVHTDNFDSGGPTDLLGVDDNNQVLNVQYTRPGTLASQSAATSAVLMTDSEDPNINCLVTGHALRNGGGSLIIPLP